MHLPDAWFLAGIIGTFVVFSGVLAWVSTEWSRYRRHSDVTGDR